eukprot:TRINITY_DN13694_c0_g3_i2.p1 TRINITY_DN13694_c0_g3~~TRINITY_DN13694_c0_g3_i2.p1  ORF type:complete len:210 (+),score=54.59 TRINITY_DN13694_c0_g3_i2:1-630(+)
MTGSAGGSERLQSLSPLISGRARRLTFCHKAHDSTASSARPRPPWNRIQTPRIGSQPWPVPQRADPQSCRLRPSDAAWGAALTPSGSPSTFEERESTQVSYLNLGQSEGTPGAARAIAGISKSPDRADDDSQAAQSPGPGRRQSPEPDSCSQFTADDELLLEDYGIVAEALLGAADDKGAMDNMCVLLVFLNHANLSDCRAARSPPGSG